MRIAGSFKVDVKSSFNCSLVGIVVLVFASIQTGFAAPAAPGVERRVILISMDGLRPDAIAAAGAHTLQALIRGGASTLICENELPPATLPNHASMVTGKSVIEHGVIANWDMPGYMATPTIFDMATKSGRKVAFFASKTKFTFLCRPKSAAVRVIDVDIDSMTDRVIDTLIHRRPDLTFIHFAEPDGAGHAHGWMSPEYLEQVRHVDALLLRIVAAMDRERLWDTTCLILTADHGGQGKTHARNTPLERHVPLILCGAGVRPGESLGGGTHVRDAAPIALFMLGMDMSPDWNERVPQEALLVRPTTPRPRPTAVASTTAFGSPLLLLGVGAVLIWLSHRPR